MNRKMTTNSQLSTTEPKKHKLNKQLNRNRIREIEITWRVISGAGEGESGGKVQEISITGRYKIDKEMLRVV